MNSNIWQNLLPQHALSRFGGHVANCEIPWLKNAILKRFVKKYPVDLSEAQISNVEDFKSFNDFFTRALKPQVRPIDKGEHSFICPVDGTLSAFGKIEAGQLFQAKQHYYTIEALLGHHAPDLCKAFENGLYATLYLAPHDYHRIHMPLPGTLKSMHYIPGKLFSVNQKTAEDIPGLFAKNERVVLVFDTDYGPLLMVLVGAMIVASISTVFAGLIAPNGRQIIHREYTRTKQQHIFLNKADEVGRFHLGSTVVTLLGNEAAQWDKALELGQTVRLGMKMSELPKTSS